ncbi:7342_t:CDS:2 [Dentiscutata heterogama]|uniref:7342_t:CDS:1 n=1 Tax=Dentiscutata heterogama TaxID=1316150 RepID=A0ACA9MHI9_9GLOM|nr:7342_t:CDS:2 [Dentiscutata heterogama]
MSLQNIDELSSQNSSVIKNDFSLVVKDPDDYWIADFLDLYGYRIEKSSIESSNFVTPKIVRDIIRNKELLLPSNCRSLADRNAYIILLLRFVLRDNAFTELTGVPLVPVNCISYSAFGTQQYYLALPSDLQFFPTVGCFVLITEELPDDIKSIFESSEFQSTNKIKKLDLDGFYCLFRHELPRAPFRDWDPDTTTTFLNRRWLENLWERISQFVNQDLKLLGNYPLIPIITTTYNNHHIYELISVKNDLPILRFPKRKDDVIDVLKKLGILFTEESRIDTMKIFIWDWNLSMVIIAIDKSRSINKISMDSLFQHIYRFIDASIKDILRQLPIWPTYSADGSYIAAYCGCLVPHGLPYFQANLSSSKTNYINYKNPDEKILLKRLDVVESSYIHYLFCIFKNLDCIRPDDPEYLEFLKEFLRLPPQLHPNWLSEYRFIPNSTKTELRFARELYDDRVLLFTTVFAGSDVFIAPELRCGWLSKGLIGLGFHDKVDDDTFIRLALEIQHLYNSPSPPSDLFDRARMLVLHFYYNVDDLNFTCNRWDVLKSINFIPSKPVDYPYLETAKFKIPKLCSFNSLRLPKHMKLCWTQCAFYDDLVIPPESVLNIHIDLGELFFHDVMGHLIAIKENIVDKQSDEWKGHGAPELLFTIINGLYEWLEDNLLLMKRIGEIGEQWFIGDLKSSLQKNSTIFLNGNDPFDLKNWTSATSLVLNIDIDVDCYKKAASKNLAPYSNLLQLCGAYNFNPATPTNFDVPHTALRRDNIVNKLCKYVDLDVTRNSQNFSHSNTGLERFHDIFFNIRGELIGTSRFFLAATCPHFERAFCAGTLESKLGEHVFLPRVNDIHPDAFRVLLKYLYGKDLSDIMNEIRYEPGPDEDEISFYFNRYIELLKYAQLYELNDLALSVQHQIIQDRLVLPQNIVEIWEWCQNTEITAPYLAEYCEKCIRDNTELLFDLRLHDIEQDIPDKKQRAAAIVELEGRFWRWRELNLLKDMSPPIYYDEDPPITFDNESGWGRECSSALEWI